MAHIRSTTYGESRLRLLRVLRRGDRHDPKDVTIGLRLEGGEALPAEPLKNLVYRVARAQDHGEVEAFALVLSAEVLAQFPQVTLARVDVAEQVWARLDAAGKAQGQAFVPGSGERRTALVTSNGTRTSIVAGIDNLVLMRTSGFIPPRTPGSPDDSEHDALQSLLVGAVSVRWSYGSGDVAFATYRQGVRAAILETFAWHTAQSVQRTLSNMADVILEGYAEITSVTLTAEERPYRPADLLSLEADQLYVAREEPLAVVEVTVERPAPKNA